MAETEERNVNVESEDFKAGYRQGYIDGMSEMADKVIEKLRKINFDENDHK